MKRSALKTMTGLMTILKPLIPIMLLCITLGTLGYLCAIAITVLGANLLLDVLEISPWSITFGAGTAVMFICAVLRAGFRYGEQTCGHYIAFKLLAVIRDRVFGTLRRLAPAKLEGKTKGDLISLITGDIELLEVFYAHTIAPVCIAVIVSLIMVIAVSRLNPVLGIYAFISYAIVGAVIPIVTSKSEGSVNEQAREELGNLSGKYLENLRGLKEIKQYGTEQSKGEEIHQTTEKVNDAQGKIKKHEGIVASWSDMCVIGLTLGMVVLSIWTRSDFNVLLLATVMLYSSFGPVLALANLSATLTQTLESGNRVFDLIEEVPQTADVIAGDKPRYTGVKIEDLSFAYDQEEILRHVNAEFGKNEIIAINGRSGSGKSTLLKLLMRFWDASDGTVMFSGCPISNVNTKHLRDLESYMIQDTDLFHDSISNNIRIGNLQASQEDIERAAKKAAIHDFILSLPNGYDTTIGELGDTLSGGEKQRIGLARAFLHKAPLLLLDEPTSNLDSLNEGMVLKAIRDRADDSTVILVSHRKSTSNIADRSYEIENGQLI